MLLFTVLDKHYSRTKNIKHMTDDWSFHVYNNNIKMNLTSTII